MDKEGKIQNRFLLVLSVAFGFYVFYIKYIKNKNSVAKVLTNYKK
jgi:hypothetical protein